MHLNNLTKVLENNKDAALHIMLPTGDFVPEHFHVTEVGKVHKTFIDCGGTKRESTTCSLQAWTAHDVDHRLTAGKLAKILKLGEKVLGTDDLPVEVEYGADVASLYILSDVEITPKGLLFVLVGKQTDCLAPDKCGVTKCCPGSNC
jgi:hypothetical protein